MSSSSCRAEARSAPRMPRCAARTGEIVAFSDANALWEPDAARLLVGAFADPRVGYACGQVRFVQAATGERATNQEGLYWRYEMAVRALESRLRSITAGNGAIYATRRDSLHRGRSDHGPRPVVPVQHGQARAAAPSMCPGARASEKMDPSIEAEFARKRRMMSHTWPIVLRGGMLSPRGYGLGYALMIFSHRVLRYATPALASARCWRRTSRWSPQARARVYVVALALQLALIAAAALAGRSSAPGRC